MFGVALFGFFFFGANDEPRRKKFTVESLSEFDALGVFTGHG